jgi:hypothetical protein
MRIRAVTAFRKLDESSPLAGGSPALPSVE